MDQAAALLVRPPGELRLTFTGDHPLVVTRLRLLGTATRARLVAIARDNVRLPLASGGARPEVGHGHVEQRDQDLLLAGDRRC